MKKRHVCVICKRKRYEASMVNVFRSSWACISEPNSFFYQCSIHSDIAKARQMILLLDSLDKLNSRHIF